MRRLLPLLVVAGIAVIVWLGSAEFRRGLKGEVGADNATDLALLGEFSIEGKIAAGALARLEPAQLSEDPPGDALLAARQAVLESGVGALRALAQQLAENGCADPRSAEAVRLITALSKRPDFTGGHALVLGSLLLDTITSADEGATGADEARSRCVAASVDLLESLLNSLRLGGGDFLQLLDERLPRLRPGSVVSVELMVLRASVAPEDRDQAAWFEQQALAGDLHPLSRAVACDAAVARRSRVEHLVNSKGPDYPAELVACLARSAEPLQQPDLALWALDHADRSVRLTAARTLRSVAEPDQIPRLVERLFLPEGANPPLSLRERALLLDSVSGLLRTNFERSEAELATAARLAPGSADGAVWLRRLRGAVRDADRERSPEPPEETRSERPRELLESLCDAVITPGPLSERLAEVTKRVGPAALVCAEPGAYAGPVELADRGLVLRALVPGETTVTGTLTVTRPAVLLGWTLEAELTFGADAGGSALVAGEPRGGVLSETDDLLLFANRAADGDVVLATLPSGVRDAALHLPASARALRQRLPLRHLADRGLRAGALGWIDLDDLEPLLGVELLDPNDPKADLRLAPRPDGHLGSRLLEAGWGAAEPSLAAGPAKVGWRPVYGNAGKQSGEEPAAILVPEAVGPWWSRQPGAVALVDEVAAR